MPIPPNQLEAFAKRKKPNDYDEGDVDEVDVEEMDAAAGLEEAPEEESEEEPEELDLDALIELVESGDGEPELMSLALDASDDNNPPAWAMDEDIWDEAKKAIEDRKDEISDYYAVVTHVYKAMGGEISEAGE